MVAFIWLKMSNRKKGRTPECGESQERHAKRKTLSSYFGGEHQQVSSSWFTEEGTSSQHQPQLQDSYPTRHIEEVSEPDILDDDELEVFLHLHEDTQSIHNDITDLELGENVINLEDVGS